MKNQEFKLKDGLTIQTYHWAVANPKKSLVIVHGFAEHALRYNDFAEILNQRDIEVFSYDQRGHGRSEGLSAYIPEFKLLYEDLHEIIEHKFKDKNFVLMGHSMGGLVAVNYVLQNGPIPRALISASAALELDKDLSPILQMLAPVLGYIFPKMPTQKLDTRYLTRSPENLKRYLSDPLVYRGGMRARSASEIIKAIKNTSKRFRDVHLPLLVIHGSSDRLTMPGGSKQLHEKASSQQKSLKIYNNMYHELIHEPERDVIINDIVEWIQQSS